MTQDANASAAANLPISSFFRKHWVRSVGYVVMTGYSLLAIFAVLNVLSQSVFRPPNQVFPPFNLIGFAGYFFFLTAIFGSGVLAAVTAYYLRGAFRALYVAGALAILSAVTYLPLCLIFNADVDFYPPVPDSQFLVGKWMDDYYQLQLNEDGTYALNHQEGRFFWRDTLEHYEGGWTLEGNQINLSNNPGLKNPWEVTKSQGQYFLTYGMPRDLDSWFGYLGLMREKEWLESN